MALTNQITVKDGSTPQKDIVLTVTDRDKAASHFRSADATLVNGAKIFRHNVELASTAKAANRVRMTYVQPIEGVVDGRTVVLGVASAVIEVNYAQVMTLEERTAFYGTIPNLMLEANVKAQSTAPSPLS